MFTERRTASVACQRDGTTDITGAGDDQRGPSSGGVLAATVRGEGLVEGVRQRGVCSAVSSAARWAMRVHTPDLVLVGPAPGLSRGVIVP